MTALRNLIASIDFAFLGSVSFAPKKQFLHFTDEELLIESFQRAVEEGIGFFPYD